MQKSFSFITAAAVCAVALVGCEWGGVSEGESWNDAYSWANFTGTYKLVNQIVDDSSSDDTDSGTTSQTKEKKTYSGVAKFTYSSSQPSYNVGSSQTPIEAGSATVSIPGISAFRDDGAGHLVYQGEGSSSGTIDYATGTFTISYEGALANVGSSITFKYYKYVDPSAPDDPKKAESYKAPITWLTLNQQGNLLTFKDNDGTTYSGKITGASCPTANDSGYITAGHIRFTFEATCVSNSRISISGSLSGDWSGSSSATTGTLANRTIDATYHTGSSATQFQAVSGSTTLYAKEITSAAGITD